MPDSSPYRGRLAPSPTGHLHLGHARTFWIAQERALAAGGTLILRNDDLDRPRCRPEFVQAMYEDLRWFDFQWTEGPDVGGPYAPYNQSERLPFYAEVFHQLRAGGFVYPCTCSRQDVLRALTAPHAGEEEPVYPGTCRERSSSPSSSSSSSSSKRPHSEAMAGSSPSKDLTGANWRFRVPDGERITFQDSAQGPQSATAGVDFGDFIVWRKDGFPSYQLATVADDAAMRISEIVRGEDLITSTFRQLLLYRALGHPAPAFHHCALVTDEHGARLAKRDAARSLRHLREKAGLNPEQIRAQWREGPPDPTPVLGLR